MHRERCHSWKLDDMNKIVSRQQLGFSLIEAIIVIVITGILAIVAANFINRPIQQYLDVARRAELSDGAHSAIRRMSRDLHLALPNSVRQSDANCVEFLMTKDGGRYRSAPPGDVLTFENASSTQFDVIGPLRAAPQAGDFIVVYNLGIAGANAYEASYRGVVAAASTTSIQLGSAIQNPLESPANRFFVLSGTAPAVSFVCDGANTDPQGNGTGRLYRISNYPISPTSCADLVTYPNAPVLVDNVASCSFNYANGVVERSGVLSIRLTTKTAHESVTIYQDVNINNVP
jgi:MSHA biogenesis protein MshO